MPTPTSSLPFARVTLPWLLAIALSFTATSTASAAQPSRSSYDLDATYRVSLFLHWDTRRVSVKTAIDLVNDSGGPVDRLDLNTVVAKLGKLTALKVRVDGLSVPATITGQTIRVPLGAPLAEDASARIFVSFRGRLTTQSSRRRYYWTKSHGIVQMYRFIPWLSRRIPFGNQSHGEPFLTTNSRRVEVRVSSDRQLKWATSGRRVARDGRWLTFLATNVRDFNLTASPAYRSVSGRSRDGRTRIVAQTRSLDGRRLVRLARIELQRYKNKTGVAYPHPVYRIAETAAGLPMESPGLIWIPGTRPAADLPFLVSHETAHQWFYGIVGNDQSTNAFADEAVADYYARKAHLSLRSSRCRADRLDRDIRDYSDRCYFEVIYVQGARFLDRLRRDFGDSSFKRAIRAYVRDYRLGLGSDARLLEAFRAEMGDAVLPRFRRRFPSLY